MPLIIPLNMYEALTVAIPITGSAIVPQADTAAKADRSSTMRAKGHVGITVFGIRLMGHCLGTGPL